MSTLISFNNVGFTYPEREAPTLTGLQFQVERGEIVLLAGSTGSGKSTLVKILCGVIPHLSRGTLTGEVHILGRDLGLTPPAELCRRVGVVFQRPEDQLVAETVEEEVAFTLVNLHVPAAEIESRVEDALGRVGLSSYRTTLISRLSGGQKQRVLLAAVLALRPEILVLDEPLSQLDPHNARELRRVLVTLAREEGLTLVVAEHHLEWMLPVVDKVVVLEDGRISRQGRVAEVLGDIEALARAGLQVPPLLRIFHQLGWRERPLTAEAALPRLRDLPDETWRQVTAPFRARPREGEPGPPLVQTRGLHFTWPGAKTTLQEVNLTIAAGERVAIMGASGSGKSTLVAALAGILPHRGLKGTLLDRGNLRRRWSKPHHGLVFQDPDLMLTTPTVARELAWAPSRQGLPPLTVANRVRGALRGLKLASVRNDAPLSLSRGQRLRVAVGSAITARPGLLLLDEPTSGQDRLALEQLLNTLMLSLGSGEIGALAFCTHDVALALHFATRVVVLVEGRVVADGEPDPVLLGELPPAWGLLRPDLWEVEVLRRH